MAARVLLFCLLLFSSSVLIPISAPQSAGKAGVIFQGFYWDVPEGGTWYETLEEAAYGLSDIYGYSVDYIWFPPSSKGMSGAASMGYDPYDYYDLGQYDQKNTTETRFGSYDELKSAIDAYHSYGIGVIGDIVINHRGGGESEYNPNTGNSTYTDFSGVASEKCVWNYDAFHPSTYEGEDEGVFGGFPDLCHANNSIMTDLSDWGQWLRGVGFDGWRFDYVKGYYPWVAEEFKNSTYDPFSVAEYWDRDINLVKRWISDSGGGISALDFPLYYTLRDALNGNAGLWQLVDQNYALAASYPMRSVTFVANHDTDEIVSDKMLAYGFILTYQGYPCVWWKDYFDYGLSSGGAAEPLQEGNGIDRLIWVRGYLGGGAPEIEVLHADDDLLIYQEMAHMGYVMVMNDSTEWKGMGVTTRFKGTELECVAWSSTVDNSKPYNEWSDGGGYVELWAPPRGYAVFSLV